MRYSTPLDTSNKTGQQGRLRFCFPSLELSTEPDFAGLTLHSIINPEVVSPFFGGHYTCLYKRGKGFQKVREGSSLTIKYDSHKCFSLVNQYNYCMGDFVPTSEQCSEFTD